MEGQKEMSLYTVQAAIERGWMLRGRGAPDVENIWYSHCKESNRPFIKAWIRKKSFGFHFDLISTNTNLSPKGAKIADMILRHNVEQNPCRGWFSGGEVLSWMDMKRPATYAEVDQLIGKLFDVWRAHAVECGGTKRPKDMRHARLAAG